MPDVVLPVLDESAAIPGVLASIPANWNVIVVDNGSTDGSAAVARAGGARVVDEARRGFGAACFAGLCAAESDVVAFMDCDGSLDGRDLVVVAQPVVEGRYDLVLGARCAMPGAWPWHLRVANRSLARAVRRRTGIPLTDLGPMRAACREELLELHLRDRRFGWPLEMVLRAATAGWNIEEVEVAYHPRGRSVEGDGHRAGHAPDCPRHEDCAPMTTIVVLAKEPRPGTVKTRLCPPCTPESAADVAAAALFDTLSAVAGSGCAGRVLALDGMPGPWLPPGFTVIPQVTGELGARLAAAVAYVAGPVLVMGMDTPQVTPSLLDDACRRLHEPGIDAVLGRAVDGGYWAIGFRDRRRGAFTGVPMSTSRTAACQLARLRDLQLRAGELIRLRDVDTFADALEVASTVPRSSFASAVTRAAASAVVPA